MKVEKLKLSGSCDFTLTTFEGIEHKSVCLEYTERSPDGYYSDSETSIDLDAEKAQDIIAFLHKAFPELAPAAPVQEPLIPEGWSLVAVTGFDQLMYWLDRCEHKGHLENCPDLIEPYEAFDYRLVTTTPPAAQRQWVGLTPQEVHAIWSAVNFDWHTPRGAVSAIYEHIEAKLKEKNA